MTFEETLTYMMNRLPMYQRVGGSAFKKSLDNIIALCDALDNPQEKYPSLHIAGTNGKGSSSHMLAAVLQASGYKTGLYTSPHLNEFAERIKVNGQEMYKEKVVEFIENNKPLIEQLSPSFFEITVAMAFDYFARQNVDIAVIETGLGGRLDSTNILKKPLVTLITNISYDHMDMLGETLPEIAGEKAGIIKQAVPVVIGKTQKEVIHVFKEKAQQKNAPIFFADTTFCIDEVNAKLNVFFNRNVWLNDLELDLIGKHQQENVLGVLQTLELLTTTTSFSLSKMSMKQGLKNVTSLTGLKGRWQTLQKSPRVICDVGHNEAGIQAILEELKKYRYRQLWVVWGMVADKQHKKLLTLLPKEGYYIFCKPNVPRGMEAQLLFEKAKSVGLAGTVIPEVQEAYQFALHEAHVDDLIFIGGSTFVVAELPI